MTWQEFQDAMPGLPDEPTKEQWLETVAKAEALVEQVDEADRGMARVILGDTLIQFPFPQPFQSSARERGRTSTPCGAGT
jgi:hypothetical protein